MGNSINEERGRSDRMNIVVCVDDNEGMLFNQRRQSRDKVLLEDMMNMVPSEGGKLWIAPFSEKMLQPYKEKCPFITVDEAFLEKADAPDYCFVENESLQQWKEKIDAVIVYRWNRMYPADTYFDIDLSGWQLISADEFPGSSHEKITKEVYIK